MPDILLTDVHGCSEATQRVIRQLIERDAMGRAKYGTTLDRDDLTTLEWLQHAQEEALDFAGYLEVLKGREAKRLDLLRGCLRILESTPTFVPADLLQAVREAVGMTAAPTVPNVAVPLTAQAVEEME